MQNPKITAKIGDHPIHPMLIPFPVAFLVATLVCVLLSLWNWYRRYETGGQPCFQPGFSYRSSSS